MNDGNFAGSDKACELGCIYCGLQRPFNDEHVFPAGLGGDDRAFMLRGLVCETCNSETFSRMEAGLMRNSPEAFARIHSQPQGRKRKKSNGGPKFQPESITIFLPEGGDAEAEIRAGGQVALLPQFSLRENQVKGQGSEASELKQFATGLQTIFREDSLLLVTKTACEDGVHYDTLTYQWDGICYQEAGRSVSSKPPELCIWKDQRPNDDVPDRPHRIFRRSGGQIVLRTGDKGTDSQFLTILRRNCQQVTGAANNAGPGTSITGAPIMVQMSASFIDRERVLAKIGLNLCAHVFGGSFVRQECFDEIKLSILTGAKPIACRDHHPQHLDGQDMIARILSATPPRHHLCMLTAGPLPGGAVAIVFAIQLYGGVLTAVTLTESASFSLSGTPIFLLVDYLNHKLSVLSLGDFGVKYPMPGQPGSS
ncbi:hypothetical protein [Rugamonas rivuli]|uniref:HNH endonuclease 5 domain-containing protein n=1 Tax=Rugamonas rivuli TaxID=2743358 RepID=A0A843S2G8_9BURK|nr:hypothetical protein [Rugamonas rivuli]MQA18455.1 hypothetical protein [Rugamonas rivuli]